MNQLLLKNLSDSELIKYITNNSYDPITERIAQRADDLLADYKLEEELNLSILANNFEVREELSTLCEEILQDKLGAHEIVRELNILISRLDF